MSLFVIGLRSVAYRTNHDTQYSDWYATGKMEPSVHSKNRTETTSRCEKNLRTIVFHNYFQKINEILRYIIIGHIVATWKAQQVSRSSGPCNQAGIHIHNLRFEVLFSTGKNSDNEIPIYLIIRGYMSQHHRHAQQKITTNDMLTRRSPYLPITGTPKDSSPMFDRSLRWPPGNGGN